MNILAKYNNSLKARPLLTKVVTSGVIYTLGDLLCQVSENYSKKETTYNVTRMRTFFLWGALIVAPMLHISYTRLYPWLVPELTTKGAFKKLAIDQFGLAPVLMLMFYPSKNLFEGRPMSNAI